MQHVEDEVAAKQLAADMRRSCLGVRIGRLSRLIGRRYESALRPLDLSIAQMEVLGALVLTDEPVRPADLSQWLATERSTVSRNLTLMQRRGYVVTTDTSPSGRSQRVTITAEGQAALAAARQAWTDVQRAVAAELGPDAVVVLDGWLDTLTGTGAAD